MNLNSVKLLLQQFPLFRSLTENEINLIVRLAVTREYKKDSHIFFQGDPLTDVYFIFSGKIKIYRLDAQGNEQIVNILKKGDMFPHQGFFRKDSYPANAQATIFNPQSGSMYKNLSDTWRSNYGIASKIGRKDSLQYI